MEKVTRNLSLFGLVSESNLICGNVQRLTTLVCLRKDDNFLQRRRASFNSYLLSDSDQLRPSVNGQLRRYERRGPTRRRNGSHDPPQPGTAHVRPHLGQVGSQLKRRPPRRGGQRSPPGSWPRRPPRPPRQPGRGRRNETHGKARASRGPPCSIQFIATAAVRRGTGMAQ